MNIYYFGADKSWLDLQKFGFRRRNTCLLKAFVESNLTERVFVVRKVTRKEFLKKLLFDKKKYNGKVIDVVFTSLIPEKLIFNRLIKYFNQKLSAVIIRRACERAREDDIIWGYWPQGFKAALDSGLNGTYVFDADHNIIEDPNIEQGARAARQKLLLKIGENADYIVSSVRSMINWYSKNGNSKGIRLRNGVDIGRFNTSLPAKDAEQLFTVGYCGTLSKWIDYDMFSAIAIRNPEWKFIVIGKPFLNNEWEKLKGIQNIELLGEKPAHEVAALLPTFDVALNLYREHPALDVDSMKLYEYIAAGVPVVSTSFHPFLKEDFNDILFLGNTLSDVEAQLKQIAIRNIQPNQAEVKQFLQGASWLSRADDFLKTIS